MNGVPFELTVEGDWTNRDRVSNGQGVWCDDPQQIAADEDGHKNWGDNRNDEEAGEDKEEVSRYS